MIWFDILPLSLLFWHLVRRFRFLFALGAGLRALRAADSRPVIAAFGDSLSAGFGVDAGLSYPDFLQTKLNEAGYKYRVINAGISGDTTSDGLARVGAVIAAKPQIVVLEFGGNDGLRGLPLARTRANLDSMIVELKKAGARVVLAGITLPPNYGKDYIAALEKMYRDLAAQYKLPLIPFLFQEIYDKPGMMQRDGIHASAKGNERVADLVLRTMRPLLKK
jgi:acyl-CoA thioesterase-1